MSTNSDLGLDLFRMGTDKSIGESIAKLLRYNVYLVPTERMVEFVHEDGLVFYVPTFKLAPLTVRQRDGEVRTMQVPFELEGPSLTDPDIHAMLLHYSDDVVLCRFSPKLPGTNVGFVGCEGIPKDAFRYLRLCEIVDKRTRYVPSQRGSICEVTITLRSTVSTVGAPRSEDVVSDNTYTYFMIAKETV